LHEAKSLYYRHGDCCAYRRRRHRQAQAALLLNAPHRMGHGTAGYPTVLFSAAGRLSKLKNKV
jgi:hypothetical protein